MKKRLMIGLAAAALLAGMVPGTAMGAYNYPGEPQGYGARIACDGLGVVWQSTGTKAGWPAPSDWQDQFSDTLSYYESETQVDCHLAGLIPLYGGE